MLQKFPSRLFLLVSLIVLLVGCTGANLQQSDATAEAWAKTLIANQKVGAVTKAAPENTREPNAVAPSKNLSVCPPDAAGSDKVDVHWFVGLGTGTDPSQITVEQSVVNDFNADPARAQDKINLILDIVPYAEAKDTLLTKLASGTGPDIVGPVGWNSASAFHGQWLDLSGCIAKFDTSEFNPNLLGSYESSEGQIGLPFAVYPSAIFYNTTLFDKAGLKYPPASYGPNNGPATYELDGKQVEWNWDTVKKVAQLLTIDVNGNNATDPGFDKTSIAQYGFTWNFETQPSYLGTYWANGSYTAADGKTAQLPDGWKAAWEWTYEGTWGAQPFIPNGSVSASLDFGNGNVFNSGKVGMMEQPAWYTCCINDVKTWDFGAMPSYKGKVNGRIDADTFRILKNSKNPGAAFKVITYLVTTGVQKLIIGSNAVPAAYGAVPARDKDFALWSASKQKTFPWVKNWDLISAGLNYPDSPSADSYMPNYNEAWTRAGNFYALLANTAGLDLATVEATFLTDLQAIFDK